MYNTKMIEMDTRERSYTIRDLENSCGIKAHTIRMWEKRYGILTPGRSDTNIRSYSEEEMKKLIAVALLNRKGLKISHIARLKDNELLHEVMKLCPDYTDKITDERHGSLIMQALRFDEHGFRKALTEIVTSSGLENAYGKVFYPLMQKAKTLWLTDCISKPQEQFIRYVIRTIIITEDLKLIKDPDKDTVVIVNMGDPEVVNDLFFLKYLLRKRGFNVILTEEGLTTGDIQSIHTVQPFSILVLNIHGMVPDIEVKNYCNSTIQGLRLSKVLVLGRFENCSEWAGGKTDIAHSPQDIIRWADSL